MKTFTATIYYRLVTDFRVSQAVFFTLVFPVFLFLIFSMIWGGAEDPAYVSFLITGILGATLASEGMFAIGEVVKEYYEYNMIRYFRVLPTSTISHFASLAVSRSLFIVIMALLMFGLAFVLYGYTFTLSELAFIGLGSVVGMLCFAALGLVLSFSNIRVRVSNGLLNFIFFLLIFLSNAYYPLREVNPSLNRIADLLPLNHVLNVIRGEFLTVSLIYCGVSIVVYFALFRYLFHHYQLKR
jgi:ABC-2 type transport system permease protein